MTTLFRYISDIFFLFRHSYLSRQRILEYQDQKLRQVIDHAYRKVPYYRNLFQRAGILPLDIRTAADLKKIPLTTKKEFKNTPPDQLLSRRAKEARLGVFKTSGSTGFPLVIRRSRLEEIIFHLFRLRVLNSYGLKSLDKMARIRSGILEKLPLPWRVMQAFGLYRQIHQAFPSHLYDTYESQEVGLIAWECKKSGKYHVCEDNVILEALKDGSPARNDEPGEVVVTSLHCYSMPFIRFCLDDVITLGSQICSCGFPYSTLERIEGKKQDYFYFSGGKEVYPWQLALLYYESAPWIQQFEIVQERENRVVLRAVASRPPFSRELDSLKEQMHSLLGDGVEFLIDLVSEIIPGPNRKYWIRRSLVRTLYEDEAIWRRSMENP